MHRGRSHRSRLWRTSLLLTVALAVALGPVPAMAQSPSSGEDIDVLRASREEVRQELAALDGRIAAKATGVERAQVDLDRARGAVRAAQVKVELARNELAVARDRVRAYAVEAFVRPPAADALAVLSIRQTEAAANASNVLHIVAARRASVITTMVARQKSLERQQQEAEAAKVQAASRLEAIRKELDSLRTLYAQQDQVAASLDDRLDAALAEAAALRALDAQVADELAAQEVALRGAAPDAPDGPPADQPAADDSPSTTEPSTTESPTTTEDSPTTTTDGTSSGSTTTTVRRTTTTTTRPRRTTTTTTVRPRPRPRVPVPNLPGWSLMTRVGGIWVNRAIASRVAAMLDAATAAGISLSGGGYRDSASQIALRQAHCGTDPYAVYSMPASRCRPPTARPGFSMHERGLAIDFMANGGLIVTRNNAGYRWLAANAARFGFYNLPSEPWHWSINGN